MENEHLLGSRGKRVLMRVFGFSALLLAACLTASAQSAIDYPYNPDFENDGFVGIEDVLEILSVYGTPFTPEQLLLDSASLTEIIESLQSQIDSLASYTNEGFGAIALNDSLLTEYLVGVAAASEEGDSTLGAWVMQLSEVVEQQQVQIDSLTQINEEVENSLASLIDSVFTTLADMQTPVSVWPDLFQPEGAYNHGCASYQGGDQETYVVPNGISLLELWVTGARGGRGGHLTCSASNWSSNGPSGGGSASVRFLLPVSAGDSIFVSVGLDGANGASQPLCGCSEAGGAGGETFVEVNGNRLVTISGGTGGSACCINYNCPQCPCGNSGVSGSVLLFDDVTPEEVSGSACMGIHPYGLVDFSFGSSIAAPESQVSIRW